MSYNFSEYLRLLNQEYDLIFIPEIEFPVNIIQEIKIYLIDDVLKIIESYIGFNTNLINKLVKEYIGTGDLEVTPYLDTDLEHTDPMFCPIKYKQFLSHQYDEYKGELVDYNLSIYTNPDFINVKMKESKFKTLINQILPFAGYCLEPYNPCWGHSKDFSEDLNIDTEIELTIKHNNQIQFLMQLRGINMSYINGIPLLEPIK